MNNQLTVFHVGQFGLHGFRQRNLEVQQRKGTDVDLPLESQCVDVGAQADVEFAGCVEQPDRTQQRMESFAQILGEFIQPNLAVQVGVGQVQTDRRR